MAREIRLYEHTGVGHTRRAFPVDMDPCEWVAACPDHGFRMATTEGERQPEGILRFPHIIAMSHVDGEYNPRRRCEDVRRWQKP